MKKDFKCPRLYLFLSMIAAIPVIPLQTFAYLSSYGKDGINYFSSSLLPILAISFAAISCLLALSAILLWKFDPIPAKTFNESFSSFPAALGFLAGGLLMLLSNTEKLTYILPIGCLVAAIYHFSLIFASKKHNFTLALVGFSTVIVCILFIAYFYFDATLEMNSPLKVSVQMGFVAAMLYLLSELRVLMKDAFPRIYYLSCACTVAIGALSAIPVPLAYLLGVFEPNKHILSSSLMGEFFDRPEYLAGSVVLLGMSITAGWRLCQVAVGKEDT